MKSWSDTKKEMGESWCNAEASAQPRVRWWRFCANVREKRKLIAEMNNLCANKNIFCWISWVDCLKSDNDDDDCLISLWLSECLIMKAMIVTLSERAIVKTISIHLRQKQSKGQTLNSQIDQWDTLIGAEFHCKKVSASHLTYQQLIAVSTVINIMTITREIHSTSLSGNMNFQLFHPFHFVCTILQLGSIFLYLHWLQFSLVGSALAGHRADNKSQLNNSACSALWSVTSRYSRLFYIYISIQKYTRKEKCFILFLLFFWSSPVALLRGGRELWLIAKEMGIQGDAVLSIIELSQRL